MNYLYKTLAFVALFGIVTASLPSIADVQGDEIVPGTVLDELSEAEVLELEKELQKKKSLAPKLTKLLYTPQPLMSIFDQSPQLADGQILKVHGCHSRRCLPRCPRCNLISGTTSGHCIKSGTVFACGIRRN